MRAQYVLTLIIIITRFLHSVDTLNCLPFSLSIFGIHSRMLSFSKHVIAIDMAKPLAITLLVAGNEQGRCDLGPHRASGLAERKGN